MCHLRWHSEEPAVLRAPSSPAPSPPTRLPIWWARSVPSRTRSSAFRFKNLHVDSRDRTRMGILWYFIIIQGHKEDWRIRKLKAGLRDGICLSNLYVIWEWSAGRKFKRRLENTLSIHAVHSSVDCGLRKHRDVPSIECCIGCGVLHFRMDLIEIAH